MSILEGRTIAGRYRVDKLLGQGGMAEVYQVWDTQRGTPLALKLLHEDLALDRVFIRRFQREAQTLAKLQHPHIVRLYGIEQADELAFMLLDYIPGPTLRRLIFENQGPMSLGMTTQIATDLCSALNFAHSQGYIHCDLKPGNILFDDQGNALLADFGIARMAEGATVTMVGAGTPAYMAPEQVKGLDPVPQTDIYAMGVILFEMVTGGERPFTGESKDTTGTINELIRWEQVNLPPPDPRMYNPDLPEPIAQIILKCLEKDPGDRYRSAQELSQALQAAFAEIQQISPHLAGEQELSEGWIAELMSGSRQEILETNGEPFLDSMIQRKRSPLWILVPVIAAVLISGIVYTLYRTNQDSSSLAAVAESTPSAIISAEIVETSLPSITPTETIIPTSTPGIGSTLVSPVDGMTMVFVPAGTFTMGSTTEDVYDICRKISGTNSSYCTDRYIDEVPQHEVNLAGYWIDQTEVTNAMYAAFLNQEGNRQEEGDFWYAAFKTDSMIEEVDGNWSVIEGYEDFPVSFISWQGASAYCQYTGRRLPTEAEWEKAAGGPDGRNYPWGEDISCDLSNYNYECYGGPAPGGTFLLDQSVYGVYDMAGNLAEWVEDYYDEDFYEQSPIDQPVNLIPSRYRVIRGGYAGYNIMKGIYSRVTYRRGPDLWGNYPSYDPYIGFRCAVSAKDVEGYSGESEEVAYGSEETITPTTTSGIGSNLISPQDGMTMVYVPAGTFKMGSTEEDLSDFCRVINKSPSECFGEHNLYSEMPQHEVNLAGYWIDQTEVTNAMYAAFLNQESNRLEDGTIWYEAYKTDSRIEQVDGIWRVIEGYEDYPVSLVSWQGASAYCQWSGRRLPTEAEWEIAAGGTDGRTYPWGESISCELSNFQYTCKRGPAPVGTYLNGQSIYGAYDMAGNMAEWVEDYYDEAYYGKSPIDQPVNLTPSTNRVIRGGSYFYGNRDLCRVTSRQWNYVNSDPSVGFRCAVSDNEFD
jgi:serine/threonine-protein kinase